MKDKDNLVVRTTEDIKKPLAPEEMAMLEALKDFPDAYDPECPPFSDAELAQFYRVKDERDAERKKQTVTLRLSPKTLRKARSLGKGYTAVLARMIEEDMEDEAKIQRCL